MRSQIYLVLIRDGRLALTVGAALEDRLLRDGYRAMALVPAVRGPEFADSDCRRHLATWRSGSESVSHAPQVVALYEDGILADLASLGLPAYVGVGPGEEPQIARWADDSGAIMLPVATARDLVDAVADHTPWSRYAADLPPARYPVVRAKATPVVRRSRQSGHGGSPVRSRKIVTVASVAGPLLLAGVPSAAIATSGPSRAPTLANAASSGSVIAVTTADVQPSSPQAGSPPGAAANNTSAASSSGSVSNFFSQAGNAISNAMAQSAQAQIAEAQANQAFANSVASGVGNFFGRLGNAYLNAAAQSAQAQITAAQANTAFWNAVIQEAPQAYQAGTVTGNQLMLPGAAIGGPIGMGLAAAAASETGPGALAAAAGGYPAGAKVGALTGYGLGFSYGFMKDIYNSLNTSPAGGSTAQTGATGSTPGGTTGGGFLSQIGQATASGDQLGQAIGGPASKLGGMAGMGYGFFQPSDGAFSTLKNTAGSLGNFGATAGGLGYTAGFGAGFLKSLLGSPPGTPPSGIGGPSAGTPDGTQAGNGAPAGDGSSQAPAAPAGDGSSQAPAAPGGTGSPNGTTTGSAPAAPASDAAPAAPAAPASDAAPAAPAAPASDAAAAAPAAPAADAAPAVPSADAPPQAPAVPAPPVVVPPPVTSSVSGNTAVPATAPPSVPTTVSTPTTTTIDAGTTGTPSMGATTTTTASAGDMTGGMSAGGSGGGGASG